MKIGVHDLRSRTDRVLAAVKAGERVVLTVDGEPAADIVPHVQRTRWLSGARLREQLHDHVADASLRTELDSHIGETPDEF
jgi:prevent-host-death family protein